MGAAAPLGLCQRLAKLRLEHVFQSGGGRNRLRLGVQCRTAHKIGRLEHHSTAMQNSAAIITRPANSHGMSKLGADGSSSSAARGASCDTIRGMPK